MKISVILIAIIISTEISGEIFFTKLHQEFNSLNESFCTILTEESISKQIKNLCTRNGDVVEVSSHPDSHIPEGDHFQPKVSQCPSSLVIEIYSKNRTIASDHIDKICKTKTRLEIHPNKSLVKIGLSKSGPEVLKLVDGGDPANRIDIVFMGDGYTLGERGRYFDDIHRLIEETFHSISFRNYLPLFNIWAIFVPSKDSGIGYNLTPKNTPFKLYRTRGILRGIFTKNPRYARQICKLTGPSGCDYPSLIANDDYYGGLGGEFAISTRSPRTGSVVLRHEFGHNFAKVGEEYDSGEVYSGANSATNLRNLKWKSWLSFKGNNSSSQIKEERLIYRILAYPLNNLDKQSLTFSFNSDGLYSRWYLFLSATGAGEPDSLRFLLDGESLPWETRGFDDKEFYDWFSNEGLTPGRHNLTIMSTTMSTENNITRTVPRMVGSVTLYEYGNEEEFHSGINFISAYPTWDSKKRKFYRPTNAGCLMRNITHSNFCSVCKEEMWLQFFKRISLIDSFKIREDLNGTGFPVTKSVALKTLELGQFRTPGTEVDGERLEIAWFRDGIEMVERRGKLELTVKKTPTMLKGRWRVEVKFITPEVRNDPKRLLLSVKDFKL